MWYKKLVNYYLFIVSILIVNLIADHLTGFLLGLRFMTNPPKATLIGMGVLVFVLYPAFHYINNWSEDFALRIFSAGKHIGGKVFGVTLAFLLCLFIILLLYMQLWFGGEEVISFLGKLIDKMLRLMEPNS